MKVFLILIFLVGAAYYFYVQRQPATSPVVAKAPEPVHTPVPAPTATPEQHGFEQLTALLNQDLNGIPVQFDAPGQTPTNALSIRRKLGTHEAARPEYRALAQACDLILQADSERKALQQACHTDLTRASFGSKLDSNSSMDHAVSTLGRAQSDQTAAKAKAQAIQAKYDQSWTTYRTQTVGQVKGLLASLAGKQL